MNCTDANLLPESTDYYEVVGKSVKIFLCVDAGLTLVVLVLFVREFYYVFRTYKHFNIAVKSIWVVSIYPVFAVSALLAVCVPRATHICDFVSSVYLSICLFQFSSLLLHYFGHLDNLLEKIKDTGFSLKSRPCCCCCVCCPVLPPTRRSLRTLRMMIWQTAVLQPIIQFISAVLWVDNKFVPSGIDFRSSYIYLNMVKTISTLIAIYGLQTLHSALEPHLVAHNTGPKKVTLLMVQVFFSVQNSIMMIPARYNKPPCDSGLSSYMQMGVWQHLVLVVEIFLLSVRARIYYLQPLELDPELHDKSHHLSNFFMVGESRAVSSENSDNGQVQAKAGKGRTKGAAIAASYRKVDDVAVSSNTASRARAPATADVISEDGDGGEEDGVVREAPKPKRVTVGDEDVIREAPEPKRVTVGGDSRDVISEGDASEAVSDASVVPIREAPKSKRVTIRDPDVDSGVQNGMHVSKDCDAAPENGVINDAFDANVADDR